MAFPATAPSQSKARLSILKRALTCPRFSRSRPHRRKVGYLVSSGILGLSAVCPAAAPSQNVRQRCLSLLHRRCPRPARPRLHRATSSWVRSSISLHSSSALSSAWPAAALSQEFERGPRVTVWEGQSAARPAAAPSQDVDHVTNAAGEILSAACPAAAPPQVFRLRHLVGVVLLPAACRVEDPSQKVRRVLVPPELHTVRGLLGRGPIAGCRSRWTHSTRTALSAAWPAVAPSQEAVVPPDLAARQGLSVVCLAAAPSQRPRAPAPADHALLSAAYPAAAPSPALVVPVVRRGPAVIRGLTGRSPIAGISWRVRSSTKLCPSLAHGPIAGRPSTGRTTWRARLSAAFPATAPLQRHR